MPEEPQQPEQTADEADLAPRPRPGFRSASDSMQERAALVAGVVRALLGAAGFAMSLLYIPVTLATPVLGGVSLLMMVTGATSTWRAARGVPSMRLLPRAIIAACALVTAASVVLVLVLGAGAFGPRIAPRERSDAPVIRFEPPARE